MAIVTWTSATSGSWTTAANWSGGQVPGPNDDAVINLPGAYLITVPDTSVNSLTLNDAPGAITTTGDVTITAGMSIAAGSLTVTFGTQLTADSLSNQGTIVDNGALILTNYDGQSLERIGGNGQLFLESGLSNVGSTLDLQSLGSLTLVMQGTIEGGALLNFSNTVRLPATYNTTATLTLDGLQIGGSPTFDLDNGTVVVDNGLTLTGPNGTGPGTLYFYATPPAPGPRPAPVQWHSDPRQCLDLRRRRHHEYHRRANFRQ